LTLSVQWAGASPQAQPGEFQAKVLIFPISGSISAAQADALDDALSVAQSGGYSAVVITLSTPGGSLDAMLRIIQSIDNSPVPVIGYVTPQGATAWSAGTYILMATHLAAMSPSTIIGSCQPVQYSPTGSVPIIDSKIINAVLEVMVTQAENRGRNVTLASLFITENINVNDVEALQGGVIEIRSSSLQDLLQQADGRQVNTSAEIITINTAGAEVIEYSYSIRDLVVGVLSDPLLSNILFIIGIFGLIYGFSTPGAGGEIIGGICLVLALIGLGFDVNITAVVAIIIGAILLIYELLTPGFGVIGTGGIILLVLGALFIIPFSPEKWALPAEYYQTFTLSIVAAAAAFGAIFGFAAYKVIKIRRSKPTIRTEITGETVEATDNAKPGDVGFVLYKGEYWNARSATGLVKGRRYRVLSKDGPLLIVEEIVSGT
jgi:membrane-bound serine protease (ClpP class)